MATYAITKLHLTGALAGMKTSETTSVYMPEGLYECCVTGAKYRVTYCAEDLVVDAADRAAGEIWDQYLDADLEYLEQTGDQSGYFTALFAAYHAAVNAGAGPLTAATIAAEAAISTSIRD